MEKVSDCCAAEDCPVSLDGPSWSDVDMCPECKEHCGWEEEDESE